MDSNSDRENEDKSDHLKNGEAADDAIVHYG
jgi:hypothetical protein